MDAVFTAKRYSHIICIGLTTPTNMVSFILKGPKVSEMALSNQVKDAIDQATNHLRDALAFAARAEHPITISTITDILS